MCPYAAIINGLLALKLKYFRFEFEFCSVNEQFKPLLFSMTIADEIPIEGFVESSRNDL